MRTDQFSESQLNPEEFEFIRTFEAVPPVWVPGDSIEVFEQQIAVWRADQLAIRVLTTGSPHESNTQCDHCGAIFKDGTVVKHLPSGQHLTIGTVCATTRFNLSQGEWERKRAIKNRQAVRTRIENAKKRAQVARALLALRRQQPELIRFVNRFRDDGFLGSLRRQLLRAGELSQRQIDFGLKSGHRLVQWESDRADEQSNAEPVPTGRAQVSGKILTIKSVDSQWGTSIKFLLKSDRGFRIWGTLPRSLDDADVGSVVQFEAQIEPSPDDPAFGFFKRPTKATITG
jgi:hypothetical protein